MCILLVLALPGVFLQQPLTVLPKQGRQYVPLSSLFFFNMMSMSRTVVILKNANKISYLCFVVNGLAKALADQLASWSRKKNISNL
jgi:hypothetical protein